MSLSTGYPQGACETDQWLELAPAQVRLFGMADHYEGLGIFRAAKLRPEQLETVFARLQEPALESRHRARTAATEQSVRHTSYWLIASVAGLVAGLGTAAAIQDHHHTAADIAGVAGLGIGLVGVVGAVVVMPPTQDQADADARQTLLIGGEDDLRAAARGVERVNQSARAACGSVDRVAAP